MITWMNLPIRRGNAPLRIARGHFATNHSHINYFVDITYQKTRLSEAKDSAHQLVSHFINDTPVDTILCLDGTAVLGTCLAEELTKSGFQTINAHRTIYVLEPEYNTNSQIIVGENTRKMITRKHDLAPRVSRVQQITIGLLGVVHRRRVGVLRCQAVGRAEHLYARLGREDRSKALGVFETAAGVAAAVEIQHHAAAPLILGHDPRALKALEIVALGHDLTPV